MMRLVQCSLVPSRLIYNIIITNYSTFIFRWALTALIVPRENRSVIFLFERKAYHFSNSSCSLLLIRSTVILLPQQSGPPTRIKAGNIDSI
jgi:hypothetical protein